MFTSAIIGARTKVQVKGHSTTASITVSKTVDLGSIPSAPAKLTDLFLNLLNLFASDGRFYFVNSSGFTISKMIAIVNICM